MKILDWLRGDESDEDEDKDEEHSDEEELPGDEDDPTTYPLW